MERTLYTKSPSGFSFSRFWALSCLCVLQLILLNSCQEEFELPVIEREPGLVVSAEQLVLRQSQAGQSVLTFEWTPGSNMGTNARINYILEVDLEENNFSDPVTYELGSGSYVYSLSGEDLNNLLRIAFNAIPGEVTRIAARVRTNVSDESVEPQFSNVATISVTPYQPVTSTLYLIGDASPNGWDAGNATPLTRNSNNPTRFSVTVPLSTGSFKFISQLGEFLPSYNKGEPEGKLVYRASDDDPDEQFVITEPGIYRINVDLENLTITYQIQEGPTFSNIYIVGDASTSGWNIDSPEAFVQSEEDPFIFVYEGVLSAGSFKILAGSRGDWCGQWYRPLVAGQGIFTPGVEQNSGCEVDNTWSVTNEQSGYYKITLNQREITVTIEPVDLYIVGDAGPNGWNIENPAPMDKDGSVYSYRGQLNAGEFKISKFKGDWCGGDWINSANPDQPISNTEYITTRGCDGPDNKWRVTEGAAGEYELRIDLSTGSMSITDL